MATNWNFNFEPKCKENFHAKSNQDLCSEKLNFKNYLKIMPRSEKIKCSKR